MSYGFYVYTDRESIATTKVYSQTSGQTYSYNYGTGQHSVSGLTDGDYVRFTAVPATGYQFKRWIYHIGSTAAPTQYSTSNPFTYYGSADNNIYIAAEGVSIGGGGGGSAPQYEVTYQTTPGSRVITVNIVGTNIKGYTLTLGVGYSYGGLTRIDDIVITSNNFSTTITAENYYANGLSVVFDAGGTYAKAYQFGFELYEDEEPDYFEWSSAVAQGLPVKNVSHTEWDNFIAKIIEILTDKGIQNQPITSEKYGYPIGTTYLTMLQDCYLKYDSDLGGYPLTAKKFNVARFIIGSTAPNGSGISDDKTSRTSKVLASDFMKLENALKELQDNA